MLYVSIVTEFNTQHREVDLKFYNTLHLPFKIRDTIENKIQIYANTHIQSKPILISKLVLL